MKELNRVVLKDSAKALLKRNYWKMVVAGFVLAMAIGEAVRVTVTYQADELPEKVRAIAAVTAILGTIIGIVITLFVLHPLEYGGT
jgi:uncharacterized protein YacL